MSAAAQQVLDSFNSLAEADKHQVAIEILHRVAGASAGDLPEQRWSRRTTNCSAPLMSKRVETGAIVKGGATESPVQRTGKGVRTIFHHCRGEKVFDAFSGI